MNPNSTTDSIRLKPEEWREAAEELLERAREISRQSAERAQVAGDTETSTSLPADSTQQHKSVP